MVEEDEKKTKRVYRNKGKTKKITIITQKKKNNIIGRYKIIALPPLARHTFPPK